jgi:tellurite resistance protein TerC
MDLSIFATEWLGKPLWMWLSFVGIVMTLLAFGLEKFPSAISLGVTFGIIAAGIVWSLIKTRQPGPTTLVKEGLDGQ